MIPTFTPGPYSHQKRLPSPPLTAQQKATIKSVPDKDSFTHFGSSPHSPDLSHLIPTEDFHLPDPDVMREAMGEVKAFLAEDTRSPVHSPNTAAFIANAEREFEAASP